MRKLVRILTMVLLVGAVAGRFATGCSKDDDQFWDDDTLGFEVQEFDWNDAVTTTDAEGDSHYKEIGVVELGTGGETHQVSVDLETINRDGMVKSVLYVTDVQTGNERTYTYEPSRTALSIQDDSASLSIIKNPNGSYTVNDQSAANGKAALQLLKASPVYADASAFGFLMTYGICQSCLERAAHRAPAYCTTGAINNQNAEEAPAVCDIFKDLCDCAACDKSGKGDACMKCQ